MSEQEHSRAALDVLAERRRQIAQEGYDPTHDDEHVQGEIGLAAACYASPWLLYVKDERANATIFKDPWPWDERFDKRPGNGNMILAPGSQPTAKRRAMLVKAGALILAEIERLDRAAKPEPK